MSYIFLIFLTPEVPGGDFDTTRWLLMSYYQAYDRVFLGGYLGGVVGPHWPNQFLSLGTDFDATLRVLRVKDDEKKEFFSKK